MDHSPYQEPGGVERQREPERLTKLEAQLQVLKAQSAGGQQDPKPPSAWWKAPPIIAAVIAGLFGIAYIVLGHAVGPKAPVEPGGAAIKDSTLFSQIGLGPVAPCWERSLPMSPRVEFKLSADEELDNWRRRELRKQRFNEAFMPSLQIAKAVANHSPDDSCFTVLQGEFNRAMGRALQNELVPDDVRLRMESFSDGMELCRKKALAMDKLMMLCTEIECACLEHLKTLSS